MATYKQLSYGSKGADVTELQKLLNQNGYSLDTDGSYGPKTRAAVTDYQTKHGLTVDGVAGSQTWGALTAAKTDTNTRAEVAAATAQPEKNYRYDADNDAVYQQALQALEGVKADTPVYAGTFDQQVKELYDQVMNQKDFSFDLNGDALWQQYKDQYQTQGKLAMLDTMGQAAALTGGYGSSYAQNVGQQAYQGHLQKLNDKVPEIYQLALDRYNNEQAMLKDKFSTAATMQADEYGKYLDALSQHNIALDRAQSAADTAYDRGNNAWLTEEQLRREDEETAYGRQQDNYRNLMNLITSTGYTPTQAELDAAGMSGAQAAALASYYDQQQKAAKVSTGARNTETANPEDTVDIPSEVKSQIGKLETAGEKSAYIDQMEQGGLINSATADYMRQVYCIVDVWAEAKALAAAGVTDQEFIEYLKDRMAQGYITSEDAYQLRVEYGRI